MHNVKIHECTGEVKDIMLCEIAVAQGTHQDTKLTVRWDRAVNALTSFRRWAVLPMVLGCTPTLVLMQGGDALSVCFNVISILFLLEVGPSPH